MITRHQAEEQANACLMYHAGAFALTTLGLALGGSRTTSAVTSLWGLGVAVHALMLYAVPDAREQILKWTAAGMEDRQRLQKGMTDRMETGVSI